MFNTRALQSALNSKGELRIINMDSSTVDSNIRQIPTLQTNITSYTTQKAKYLTDLNHINVQINQKNAEINSLTSQIHLKNDQISSERTQIGSLNSKKVSIKQQIKAKQDFNEKINNLLSDFNLNSIEDEVEVEAAGVDLDTANNSDI